MDMLWTTFCQQQLPYTCVGEKFREFRKLQAIRENIIRECLVFVHKDRAIALIRENIIREMIYLAHSRTFR